MDKLATIPVTVLTIAFLFYYQEPFRSYVDLDYNYLLSIYMSFISVKEISSLGFYYYPFSFLYRFHKYILTSLYYFQTPIRNYQGFFSCFQVYLICQTTFTFIPRRNSFNKFINSPIIKSLISIGDYMSNTDVMVFVFKSSYGYKLETALIFLVLSQTSALVRLIDYLLRIGVKGISKFIPGFIKSLIQWIIGGLIVFEVGYNFNNYNQILPQIPHFSKAENTLWFYLYIYWAIIFCIRETAFTYKIVEQVKQVQQTNLQQESKKKKKQD